MAVCEKCNKEIEIVEGCSYCGCDEEQWNNQLELDQEGNGYWKW